MDDDRAFLLDATETRGLRIGLASPPSPSARRLLDFLGVTVDIVSPHAATADHRVTRGQLAFAHRESVARALRRRDGDGDLSVKTCGECGCELDVQPPPHDPRCTFAPPLASEVDANARLERDEGRGEVSRTRGGRQVTKATHSPDGSLTISESNRRQKAAQDEMPLEVSCTVCDWTFRGRTEDALREQREHREAAHPELLVGRALAERQEQQRRERQEARAARKLQEEAEAAATVEDVPPVEPENGDEATVSPLPAPDLSPPAVPPAGRSMRPRGYWTEATVIKEIRALHDRLGRPPRGSDDTAIAQAARRFFDSWAEACKKASVDTPPRRRWTPDAIIAALRTWAAAHGAPPAANDWLTVGDGRPDLKTVVVEFGSWNAAVEAAGFEPRTVGGQRGNTNALTHGDYAGRNGRRQERAEQERQEVPVVWRVKVPGTGLRYRTVAEAWVAANEIELDGQRVAEAARADEEHGRADVATDKARELAERIRAECEAVAADGELPERPTAPDDVEPVAALPELRARELEPALLQSDPDAWIERLEGEAGRLELRAGGFRKVVEGLRILQATEDAA